MDYYVFCRREDSQTAGSSDWEFKMAFPNRDDAEAFVSRSRLAGGVEFTILTATSEFEARANLHLDLANE